MRFSRFLGVLALLLAAVLAPLSPAKADTSYGQYNTQILLKSCGTGITCYAVLHVDSAGNIIGAAGNPDVVSDSSNLAYQGVVAMTVGTTYTAARGLLYNCSVGGNVTVTFTDGSTLTFPVLAEFKSVPFAVTKVNSATATCSYYEMN
jgi:hypothetical protein